MYLTEISPTFLRGGMGVLYQWGCAVGILVSQVYFSYYCSTELNALSRFFIIWHHHKRVQLMRNNIHIFYV